MVSYRTTRILQITLIIVIIVIAVAALISVSRVVFSNTINFQDDASVAALTSTSADRAVRMTVRGDIVADEDFRSYQIEITPNTRVLTTYSGYLHQHTGDISLTNNIPSYEQLVYALSRANMMRGTELTGASNDTRGVCANGFLYEFQILKADKSVKKLWTTSCSSSAGSLKASASTLKSLFIDQIPGAQAATDKLW